MPVKFTGHIVTKITIQVERMWMLDLAIGFPVGLTIGGMIFMDNPLEFFPRIKKRRKRRKSIMAEYEINQSISTKRLVTESTEILEEYKELLDIDQEINDWIKELTDLEYRTNSEMRKLIAERSQENTRYRIRHLEEERKEHFRKRVEQELDIRYQIRAGKEIGEIKYKELEEC